MVMIVGIPNYDATRDTAGTGGIKRVERKRSTKGDEGYIYSITGLLLPSTKRRNYQSSSRYFQIGELDLPSSLMPSEWELAHLWPPRFGDESAAGIMAAPKEMNQTFQNHKVEPWLESLRHATDGPIHITASAACWCSKFLRNIGNASTVMVNTANGAMAKQVGYFDKTEVLKWVRYDVTNCPTGTRSPAGGPLLGTSILMQMDPPRANYLPRVVHTETDTIMSW